MKSSLLAGTLPIIFGDIMEKSNATVAVYGFRLSTYFVDMIRAALRNHARVATRSLIEQYSPTIIEDAPFSKRGLIETYVTKATAEMFL